MSLKFKGDKPKKKRLHKEIEDGNDQSQDSGGSVRARYGKYSEGKDWGILGDASSGRPQIYLNTNLQAGFLDWILWTSAARFL